MANPQEILSRAIGAVDGWQRRHPIPAITYGMIKKFSDDNANLLVVALGWYGFTAIYPLLLVVVTVFGYIGAASLGSGIVHTLHQFPVIGSQFNPGQGGSQLHGSVFGLIIGVAGLLYGAQGVTQTAEQAMARVWNVPATRLPGFLPRLGRSLGRPGRHRRGLPDQRHAGADRHRPRHRLVCPHPHPGGHAGGQLRLLSDRFHGPHPGLLPLAPAAAGQRFGAVGFTR